MTTALISAGAALAGVALGPLLTHGSEKRQWRRQQRADATSQLLRALSAVAAPYLLDEPAVTDQEAATMLTACVQSLFVFGIYWDKDTVALADATVNAAALLTGNIAARSEAKTQREAVDALDDAIEALIDRLHRLSSQDV